MQFNILFDNLTIFSVLKMIFIQQSYRVVYLHIASTTELDNDFSTEVTALAHQYLIPINLMTADHIRIVQSKCEEPILNIVFTKHLSSAQELEQLNIHLRPDEVNLILLTVWNVAENQIDLEPLMKFDKKLLIMSNRFIASIDRFRFNGIHSVQLQPLDIKSTEYFVNDFFDGNVKVNGMDLNIFLQHLPPESSVTASDDREIFTGPDGSLSELLAKSLGVNPNFWSDIGVMYPLYKEWRNNPMVAKRLYYRDYHKEILTNNFISEFNRSANDPDIYLHMSANMVDADYLDNTLNWNTDSLYPHGKDCLLIIVPRQHQIRNLFTTVAKHGDIQTIGIVLAMFVVVRIIIQKATLREWFLITFKTLQLFLAQGHVSNYNAAEVAWSSNLRGFSLFGITTISAIICKSMINVERGEIDTIKDLIASNLSVAVPDTLQHQFDVFATNLDPDLRKKIVFKKLDELDNAIMKNRDFSRAYVYQEATAQFLLKLTNFFGQGGVENSGHIMKEQLYCKLTSYRITRTSPYKRLINSFIRKFIEAGLYDKQLEWNNQLSDAMFESYRYRISGKVNIALTLDIAYEVFLLYLIGTAMGLVVFIGEVIFRFVEISVST